MFVYELFSSADRDYMEVNQSFTFNEGGVIIPVCVNVTARHDTIVEGAESFYVVGQVEGDNIPVFSTVSQKLSSSLTTVSKRL